MDDHKSFEEFARQLEKNPKLLEQLQKRAELDEFRAKFNVERASPFKCPACSQYGVPGGSLWMNKDDHHIFICRKCKLQWRLECLTEDNDTLIINLKKVLKGEE